MRTVCVVQARMNSIRLPMKVTQLIAGKPVLQHVLERVSGLADQVVCAVPDRGSEALMDIAALCAVPVFPGSEHDVLSRTLGAAREWGAELVMRVTSDCPLIDPAICSQVLGLMKRGLARSWQGPVAAPPYVSNVHPTRSFPKGMDCEVTTMERLEHANAHAFSSYDREHVMPFISRQAGSLLLKAPVDQSALRLTLDDRSDLTFIRRIWEHGDPVSLPAILRLIQDHDLLRDQ